jgi:FG-GAP-like repeat
MATYTFQPTTTAQFVDWSDPAVWIGGVPGSVPNGPSAEVVIPVVTLSGGETDASFISIASDESYSVESVSLASNYLTIDGDLTVATDFAIQAGGEIDMGGGTLDAGTVENDGIDIQGDGQVITTGLLTNDSEIVGNGLTLTLGGLVNDGALIAASGNLTVQAPSGFAQFSDGSLTGGAYEATTSSSTLYLDVGGVVTTDAAAITLSGGGAIDSYDSANSSYVSIESTMGLIAATGTLSLTDQTVDWQTPLTVAGALSLSSSARDEAVLDATQLTIDPDGTVGGAGTINGPIANSGAIFAGLPLDSAFGSGGGELDIQGAVTGDGRIEIRPEEVLGVIDSSFLTSTLELGGPDSDNVSFADGTGTLQLDDPSAFNATITLGGPGDQIILSGVSYASVTGYTYADNATGGALTINAGATAYTLKFTGNYDASSFALSAGPQLFQSSPPSLLITHVGPDILWQNANGQASFWDMNGDTRIGGGAVSVNPGPAWTAIGTGTFFSGDTADILWRNTSTGQVSVWEMDGSTRIGGGAVGVNPGPAWTAVGTGDFNHDGLSDILFQNASTGQVSIWEMNGNTRAGGGAVSVIPGAAWKAVGTGDFYGNGDSDILFQNTSTGQVSIWEMDGNTRIGGGAVSINPGTSWKAIGTGDFNHDGLSDILFQNTNTDLVSIWEMDGNTRIGGGAVIADAGAGSQAIGTDGGSDILFQNPSTGQATIWEMSGNAQSGGGAISANPGSSWRAVGLT